MIHLKDYVPINKAKVKIEWNKIMNVPNDQWNILEVEKRIDLINNVGLAATLHTVALNMLPYLVIEILNKK